MGLNENRPWCDKIFFIFKTFIHHKKSCQQNPLADKISRFRTTEADNFSFLLLLCIYGISVCNGKSPRNKIPVLGTISIIAIDIFPFIVRLFIFVISQFGPYCFKNPEWVTIVSGTEIETANCCGIVLTSIIDIIP